MDKKGWAGNRKLQARMSALGQEGSVVADPKCLLCAKAVIQLVPALRYRRKSLHRPHCALNARLYGARASPRGDVLRKTWIFVDKVLCPILKSPQHHNHHQIAHGKIALKPIVGAETPGEIGKFLPDLFLDHW